MLPLYNDCCSRSWRRWAASIFLSNPWAQSRMEYHPLPERRLIIHLSGEVKIGSSDGSEIVLRAGDIRLMDDVSGKGHQHDALSTQLRCTPC